MVFVLLYPQDRFVPRQGVGLICHDLKYGLYSIQTEELGGDDDEEEGETEGSEEFVVQQESLASGIFAFESSSTSMSAILR